MQTKKIRINKNIAQDLLKKLKEVAKVHAGSGDLVIKYSDLERLIRKFSGE